METRYVNSVRGELLRKLQHWPSGDQFDSASATVGSQVFRDKSFILVTPSAEAVRAFSLDYPRAIHALRSCVFFETTVGDSTATAANFSTSDFETLVSPTPFEELELLRSDTRRLDEQLARLRAGGSNGERVAERILQLQRFFSEETDGGCLSVESLDYFASYFLQQPNAKLPSVMLTPDGEIFAQWIGDKRRVTARFFQSGDVKFIYSYPNSRHDDHTIRLTGLSTFDSLWDELRRVGATPLLVS